MLDEYWVTFEMFPNYAISNYGTVVNLARDRELKPSRDRHGLYRVVLYRNGVPHHVYIHRLVAMAFFLNYDPAKEVEFINGDKSDYTVLNLTLSDRGCREGAMLW